MLRSLIILLTCLLSLPALALSDSGQANLKLLQTRWAEINYQAPAAQREKDFANLSGEAAIMVRNDPAPELLIWQGIILSTYAGAKGGLGALDLVKQARTLFEQAIKADPKALDGSAYTSLGSLYYQVPGWPIGFGDDDKARTMLKKALQIDPNGIDANYFYADFLREQGEYKAAAAALEKAIAAPPRAGRETADQGRRKEAQAMLTKVRAELAKP